MRASYAVDLETLVSVPRRLWHVGCYDPMANIPDRACSACPCGFSSRRS